MFEKYPINPAPRFEIDYLIQELGARLGLPLSMPEGAVALTDCDGHHWIIETLANAELLIIHCELDQYRYSTPTKLTHWLCQNTRNLQMRGASIGLEQSTNTVRLSITLQADLLDPQMLETTLHHMVGLRRNLLAQQTPE